MPAQGQWKVKHVEDALRRSGGIVSGAAQVLKCTPQTVRNYMKRHPSLSKIQDDIVEDHLDMAEGQLIKAITDSGAESHMTAVIFYLRTKGRKRGYIQEHHHAGPNGEQLQAPPVVITMPDNGRLGPDPDDQEE